MSDYINREDAISAVKHAWAKGLEPSQYIKIIPATDVTPVKHGKWIQLSEPKDNVYGAVKYKCSNCEDIVFLNPNNLDLEKHCRNCGAKMDLED